MIRVAKAIGIAVGVLVVVIVVSLAWIVGTQSGSRFALSQVETFLPEGIELGTARGRLADELVLEDVRVVLESLEVTITRSWLRWSPGELLRGRLQIAELGADGVRYRALAHEPEEPEAEPFTLPERFDLPVSLRIEHAAITDVEARPAPEADPVAVDRVILDELTFADTRLVLGALEVVSPQLRAEGRLRAVAAGDYPLDAELRWRLDPTAYVPLAGTTRLDGSLASLTVNQRLAEPYGLELSGTLVDLVHEDRPMTLSLTVDAADVRLTDISGDLPEATVSLEALLEGPLEALAVRGHASGTDAEQRRFEAEWRILAAPDAIAVEALTVRQPGRDGALEGAGRIALAEEATANLTIRWRALEWPLAGAPAVVSPRGTLELMGPASDYRLNLDTRLEPAGAPALDLRVEGGGDLTSATLHLAANTGDHGTLNGDVDLRWDPDIGVDAVLAASGFDPATFVSGWPGEIDLSLDMSARVGDADLSVTLDRLEARGRLRDEPLTASAQGRYRQHDGNHTATIEQLEVSLSDTRVDARGEVGEQADLTWRIESPRLAVVWPALAGTLSGSGRVSGRPPRVRLEAELQGRELAYAEERIARFDLDLDLDLSGDDRSHLAVSARDGTVAGTRIGHLVIEGGGTPGRHDVTVELDSAPVRARLEVGGTMEALWQEVPAWHFTLTEGRLAHPSLTPWRLVDGASGTLTAERMNVERHCWQADDARLCLGAERSPEGMAASLGLEALPFAYFAPLLPEDLDLEGRVMGSAQLAAPAGGAVTAEAALETTTGRVTLPARETGGPLAAAVIHLEPSRLTLDVDPNDARLRADIHLDHGRIALEGATSAAIVVGTDDPAAERATGDHELRGSLTVAFPDLAFLSDLLTAADEVEGSLAGTLEMSGTLKEPALSGSLEVENGSVFVPEPGITLTDLRASLGGLGREGVSLTASADSGDGNISLDGHLSVPGEAVAARLDILGANFEVLNNDDGRVLLSPDLRVTADPERIDVTGSVHVPQAQLTPGARAPAAVTPSQDQVLVDDGTEEVVAAPGRDVFADIRVTMGDEVHFDGFGLTTRIEGNVLLDQEPDTPTTASGELRLVDGEYRAYGQGLVIETGTLFFAGGPVTQPALDVRAVRRPREDITVGAHVQGPLEDPTFELFSEPPMSQQEQLSWLVLGRSLEEAPSGEENALSRAALALGLRGGDFLARNIGEQVGIDDIGIETGSGEAGAPSDPAEAALVIGKYLSPRLYVSYGIGLFNPENVLEMQYEISRNLSLVTQSSGDATGADLLYTVERGGN